MSWSYRIRGRVARSHTKVKRKARTLRENHRVGQTQATRSTRIGPSGPPRKRVTAIADMVITFMNSARKNRANRIELYSVWNPPTSSCSASTRSNGGRFNSAVPATRKTRNGTTPVVTTFQFQPDWLDTISWVDREPPVMKTVAMARPSAAS